MKVPSSHIRHMKSKKIFNKNRAQIENQRKVLRAVTKERKP
ncbi:MAG: hypothetical protein ABID61_01260 [Candidatus Micrarchaeota archaeon]